MCELPFLVVNLLHEAYRSSDLNMGLPTVVVLHVCRLVTIILAGTLTHSDLSILQYVHV